MGSFKLHQNHVLRTKDKLSSLFFGDLTAANEPGRKKHSQDWQRHQLQAFKVVCHAINKKGRNSFEMTVISKPFLSSWFLHGKPFYVHDENPFGQNFQTVGGLFAKLLGPEILSQLACILRQKRKKHASGKTSAHRYFVRSLPAKRVFLSVSVISLHFHAWQLRFGLDSTYV